MERVPLGEADQGQEEVQEWAEPVEEGWVAPDREQVLAENAYVLSVE
jgi:hypothetical protein